MTLLCLAVPCVAALLCCALLCRRSYYRLFAVLYGWMGRFVDVSMVNSTWTKDHIVKLWGRNLGTTVVYPPCNTAALASDNADRTRTVLSVAQFRPEKDHALQLRAFKAFKDMGGTYARGWCRWALGALTPCVRPRRAIRRCAARHGGRLSQRR